MVVSNPPGDITIEDRSQRNNINSWARAARLAGPPERSSCFSTTKGTPSNRVHFYLARDGKCC